MHWKSPWYGIESEGWFLSCHVFAKYVKVTFLNGNSLNPSPPGAGKDEDARWGNIHEGELDEQQREQWVPPSRPPCPAGAGSEEARSTVPKGI